jgi:hypothetical protein
MAHQPALEALLPLRDRLALAALGALVGCAQGGCSDPSARPETTPQSKGDPSRPTGTTKTSCFEPHTSMRASGTGTPVPKPPPSAFDSNGCRPFESVTDACCNPAVSGPKFVDGECCYTFPTDSTCCGRPFVVEGRAIVAEAVERSDWGARAQARRARSAHPPRRRPARARRGAPPRAARSRARRRAGARDLARQPREPLALVDEHARRGARRWRTVERSQGAPAPTGQGGASASAPRRHKAPSKL